MKKKKKRRKTKVRRGRPRTMDNPISRTIQLDASEWAKLDRLEGAEGSYANRIRALMRLAECE